MTRVRVALSRASYVTLRCMRTHVVNCVYTMNCAGIKTRSRVPVVIKTNQRSMATACDHCAACGTVILQACSKYQTEKGSRAQRVCIAVPLSAPLSQTDSIVFKGVINSSVNFSKYGFCTPVKMKRGHCLHSSHSRDCLLIPRSPAPHHARLRL